MTIRTTYTKTSIGTDVFPLFDQITIATLSNMTIKKRKSIVFWQIYYIFCCNIKGIYV